MGDVIIKATGIGKKYRIQHKNSKRYSTLRDVIANKVQNTLAFRLAHSQVAATPAIEDFWALKDVSFEVKRGEVVGIIGRNGAGKSTLLKILSRITDPTEGRAEINGRVASLLEVGTGFHPELTGRENIYLNGAILGMTRAEITRKFDEIVAFAEVDKFIDTPVKRYSSGMYVRLAFAVAAHLEPDILIVDEVLAVGDAEFQRKCLGKMGDVAAKQGRTILLVSHNMAAISGLCRQALWLRDGTVAGAGAAREVVREYLATVQINNSTNVFRRRLAGDDLRIEGIDLLVDNVPSSNVQAGQCCRIRTKYRILTDRSIAAASCAIMLFSEGQKLTNLWTDCHREVAQSSVPFPKEGFFDCYIPKWPFRNHIIRVDVFSHIGHVTQDWIEEALIFNSHDGNFFRSGVVTNPNQGIMFVDHKWSIIASDHHSTIHVTA
jgi:lipopolysaccharide transport system ATP-binding protein